MLRVIKSGFYSTLQDNGRFGYRKYGVPISGVMDAYSSHFANALLGNNENCAVLEMTMIGGVFKFLESTYIGISGADMSPELNKVRVKNNSKIFVAKGDILSFNRVQSGFRTYLAVKNGFNTITVMGSRSQYAPITLKCAIEDGDQLDYTAYNDTYKMLNTSIRYDESILSEEVLEVCRGPEFYKLSDSQKKILLGTGFKVSKNNNRMAYQLEPCLENSLAPILTAPVLPGTVQLTPFGNIIVLMRDCQTTGGYPRILQLAEKALSILGQKTMTHKLNFKLKDQV